MKKWAAGLAVAGQFWFGTDRLWTALPETGAWIELGHYTPTIQHSGKSFFLAPRI
jgi:hypothetical protein